MTDGPVEPSPRQSILIVDDDPRIRFLLQRILERTGYAVRLAADSAEAEVAIQEETPNLVLLDVELPDGSGAALLHGWRARGLPMPVVMLTAHGNADREASLLEAGADDYIDKPVSPRVLSARVANVLRRAGVQAPAGEVLTYGPLSLRVRERRATVDGRRVSLTRTETALLAELMRLPGAVRPYDELLVRIWGPPYVGQVELLHTNVYRLRRKLETDPAHPSYLVATPGVGYSLLPEASPAS
jgi:two-component system KDP operon response regulator KdpE